MICGAAGWKDILASHALHERTLSSDRAVRLTLCSELLFVQDGLIAELAVGVPSGDSLRNATLGPCAGSGRSQHFKSSLLVGFQRICKV